MEAARGKAEEGSWSWLSWGRTGEKWWAGVEETFGEFVQRLRLKVKDYLLLEIEETKDQQLGKGSAPLQMGC